MFSFFGVFCFSQEYEVFFDSMYSPHKVLPLDPTKFFSICEANPFKKDERKIGEIISGEKLGKIGEKFDCSVKTEIKYNCEKVFNENEVENLKNLIKDEYRVGFSITDLPVASYTNGSFRYQNVPIGYSKDGEFFLRNRFSFHISCDTVKNTSDIQLFDSLTFKDTYIPLKSNETVKFSYSFLNVDDQTHKRTKRDAESAPTTKSVKLYFVLSFVATVVCVSVPIFLFMQNRINENDTNISTRGIDLEFDDSVALEEIGWRLLHGDVFRGPQHNILFSSLIGIGLEFLLTFLIVFTLSYFGIFEVVSFSTFVEPFVLVYFFLSPLNGFFATKVFKTIGRQFWKKNLLLSGLFASVFFIVCYVILQFCFISGASSARVSLKYIIKTSIVVFGGTLLFHVIGSVPALKTAAFTVPTAINQLPRHIPRQPFTSSMLFGMFVSGFAVFTVICYELHAFLEAAWTGYSFFESYGTATLTTVFAILVSAGTSVIFVYLMLSSEDYRWWWKSFIAPASAGIYAFIYSVVYASHQASSTDMLPYIIESLLIGFVIFVTCGCAGFIGSFIFVMSLYDSLKME